MIAGCDPEETNKNHAADFNGPGSADLECEIADSRRTG